MDPRECIKAFWSGERPKQIPYTIYWWEWNAVADDPAWRPMFRDGLRVTFTVPTSIENQKGVDYEEKTYTENGDKIRRCIMKTSEGDLLATWRNDWHDTYWLKTPDDYRIMTHIVENTDISADYEATARAEKNLGEFGIVYACIPRTPLQTILVDYAGLENFGIHLLMYPEEVRGLYDALLKKFRIAVEIVAGGKDRYVNCFENFSAETLGPDRYAEFLLPVYNECFPMLHQAGKIVGTHYDGRIASCKHLVAQAPIDVIESFTEPPEGDMSLKEARETWPSKSIWHNVGVSDYALEPAVLRNKILERIQAAAPDGRRVAIEVSEHLPKNWRESMPIVLAALREMRG